MKARPEQVEEHPWLDAGYEETWHPAEEAGYSGALLLTKRTLADLRLGLETPEFEREGRVIEADYGEFVAAHLLLPQRGDGSLPGSTSSSPTTRPSWSASWRCGTRGGASSSWAT